LPAAAGGVEAASSSARMPSPATAFFTRAIGRKRLLRAGHEAPPHVASTCCIFNVAWEFLVLSHVFPSS
jgi:hypothetical protein